MEDNFIWRRYKTWETEPNTPSFSIKREVCWDQAWGGYCCRNSILSLPSQVLWFVELDSQLKVCHHQSGCTDIISHHPISNGLSHLVLQTSSALRYSARAFSMLTTSLPQSSALYWSVPARYRLHRAGFICLSQSAPDYIWFESR